MEPETQTYKKETKTNKRQCHLVRYRNGIAKNKIPKFCSQLLKNSIVGADWYCAVDWWR